MNETVATTRADYIAMIDDVIRQITWQSHKQLLQTLSRPEISLTMPQMVTLFAIRNAGTCRMSELAEVTQQSAGTLTGIVDRLILDHLVGRVRDLEDRRVVQVTLTPQGEERLALVEQARREDMEQILYNLRLNQLAELEGMLRMLLNGIHDLLNSHTITLNPPRISTRTTPVFTPFQSVQA
ncbi:MarR family winged helix-turn-helix transcriptional regulator [Candidatus Viridilinea mediisalina]|uniref:MarR family transcriptional regulator n=1 Tax=Candidatus Viridilinea mediisalina TaxID=2024553 RepID=A0A2A6RH17_9CHLR|nr:MarR family transcriptional regulator [Candidatus Viridilinea mediisalina]PDW02150.1 MarR family transcriptional regulator [Candidatus Viridilinea mediisalina]